MATLKTEFDAEAGVEDFDDLPLLEEKHPKRVSWKLPLLSGKFPDKEQEESRLRRLWTIVHLAILVVLAGFGVASIVARIAQQFGPPQIGYVECHCGNSVEEAIALGCKFDLLGPMWAPDQCRDDPLTAEFLKAGPGPNGTWEFWFDHEHTKPMSIEHLSYTANDPEAVFFGTWEFHVKHCMYQWRKHWRGLERGYTKMDVENTGLSHIAHCEGVILRKLGTRAKVELNVPRIGWVPPFDDDDFHTGTMEHGYFLKDDASHENM